ncbi:FG-GAP-like repeat-containing protein [Bacteroidota bacterium]
MGMRIYKFSITIIVGVFFILSASYLFAQVPVINKIDKKSGTVFEKVLISGSGFGDNIANLKVFFGAVRGKVLETTGNSVLVEVPAGATAGNIVIENNNGYQAFSSEVFYLSYGGKTFNPGSLGDELSFTENRELFDVCLCDLNDDGLSDIINTPKDNTTDFLIFQNQSSIDNLQFTKLNKSTNPTLDVGSPTRAVVCGDIDGDGKQDLVLTKELLPRNIVYVMRNVSTGSSISLAQKQELYLIETDYAIQTAIRDLDMDGKPEIIVTNSERDVIVIFKNISSPGNILFNDPVFLPVEEASGAGTWGIAVEDLDQDGFPEIITNPYLTYKMFILPNQSSAGNLVFGEPFTINSSSELSEITSADFNCDGKIDIAATDFYNNKVAIYFNSYSETNGEISFEDPLEYNSASPWGISTADLNGDGNPDLVVTSTAENKLVYIKNVSDGNTNAFEIVDIPTINTTRYIKAGDLDGDAKPDLAFSGFSTTDFNLSIIRNGNCVEPEVIPVGPLVVCTGDAINLKATLGIGLTYKWFKGSTEIAGATESVYQITQPEVNGYYVSVGSESGSCNINSNIVIANSGSGVVPDKPVITNNGPFCFGETISLSAETVTNGQYFWTGPNDFSSSDQNISIPNAATDHAGAYNLRVMVGDCSSDISVTVVEVITLPDFDVTSSDPVNFCEGSSATLQIANLPGYLFQWTKDGVEIGGATSSTYVVTADGAYGVKLEQIASGCIATSTDLSVDVLQIITAAFSVDNNACVGEDLTFSNNSTYDTNYDVTNSWAFGDGSTSQETDPVYAYTSTGDKTPTLTVAYVNGACNDVASSTVTVVPSPEFTIMVTPEGDLCEGDTAHLEIDQDFASYLWSTEETTKGIDVASSGNYSVTATNDQGCEGIQSEDLVFGIGPVIVVTSSPDTVFNVGDEVQLEASGAVFYIWSPGETLSDSTVANPIANPVVTTTYMVKGRNDAGGCEGIATITLTLEDGDGPLVDPLNVFSPNGDNLYDVWTIENIDNYPDCVVQVFAASGLMVYEAQPYENELNAWNAVYNGEDLPEGAYFYMIRCPDGGTKSGSVMVIR